MKRRQCSRCPGTLCRRNKTGLCRVCGNSDRALIEKRARGISKARLRRLAVDDEFAASQREHGRWLGLTQNGNARFSSEARRRAHQKASDTALPWCPRDRRAEYKRLVKNGGLTPRQARARIEATISRFDRQMLAVQRGAAISPVIPMPTRVISGTLGGVSPALY